jgi:arylsulfatase A-like enzyme
LLIELLDFRGCHIDMIAQMNRREFFKAAGVAATAGRLNAQQPRPNVIVILADDLGYGDLACYGSKVNRTPNLDRMAEQGVRFTDFYTPMPFCAPTRAALLTGRYPFRSGMTSNPAPDAGINDVGIPASEVLLSEAFKEAGYATMCIGKWHLGHTASFLPVVNGFDEYYGILYSNDMRPVQIVENDRVVSYPVVQSDLTRNYTNAAVRFIERNRSRPFFLYLPHAMPHKPLAASEAFYTPETPQDLYADVINELDWSIGRVLAKVQELGLDENTLVIFTSDNGPWFGGSTGGLRGMKGSTFDGGVRVPMIARWPGRIPPGRATSEVAGTIDIYPTLCAIAGITPPQDRPIDGKNIFPLMTTEGAKSPHETLFIMGGPILRAVRSGKWKLHVHQPQPGMIYQGDPAKWIDPRGPDGVTIIAQYEQVRPDKFPGVQTGDAAKAEMLFDMEADPAEQKDVAAQHPDVVARLRELFRKMESQVPRPRPARSGGVQRLSGGELRYDIRPRPEN